ncbi:MAG: arginine repressor [Clostridia bacterium]|nr:arginine repressor [Clostridia bacterium]
MKQKSRRHSKIIEIVRNEQIETQDELTAKLNREGFSATQATVSRDIKELQLVKILTSENRYRYALPSKTAPSQPLLPSKFLGIIREGLLSVEQAQNLVVVKCYSGMAQGVCAAIDSLEREGVIGSIAGDDTIFLATRDNSVAKKIVDNIKETLGV